MSTRMTQVGVAWKKTTQNGKEFMSVVLTNPTGPDSRLSVWGNGFKDKEGQPDFIVYKSADERPAGSRGATTAKSGFPACDFPSEDTPPAEDEIPF